MRIRTLSAALVALALVASSCSENNPAAPAVRAMSGLSAVNADAGSSVVISEVYGGGGNSGAQFKNDFIELHNRSDAPVSIAGWSVQYASAAGAFSSGSNTPTVLSGSIPAGGYVLIQEAKGSGGTVDLPTPDFIASIPMSATDGKVALVKSTAVFVCSGTAPACASPDLIDLVGFGSANVYEGTAALPALSNTKSGIRLGNGCTDTNDNVNDFTTVSPPTAPRNSASAPVTCNIQPPGSVDHVVISPASASAPAGATQAFTAAAFDASNQPVTDATFTWSLDPANSSVASVSANGIATALAQGDVGIVVTAQGKSDTAAFHVDPPIQLPETRFSEIHYDNSSDDVSEQIEIEGPAQTNLSDWSVVLYDGTKTTAYDSRALTSVTIPATCGARGVVVVPFPQIQNGSPDGFALVHAGEVVQFLSYEGAFTATDGPAAGKTSIDIGVAEPSTSSAISSLQLDATSGKWVGPTRRSFGRCNSDGPPPFDITFSGRLPISDPALPVGFEDQLFATVLDAANATVSTPITWTSETPAIASVDQFGVMHALTAGTATFRATGANGATATYSLPTIVATLGGTAEYTGNAEFGIPADGDASDDFIITRDQYTISYNKNRNTPNWVSYEFDATHFGDNVDRCDCFTHDPALPASFTHLSTADYTGAGAFAGYGIDRGHMARSFDFTSGALDNARSYYLSNLIPQASNLNQGPWAVMETYLGNLARNSNKEVYIIDGVAGSKGTVKGEGKIVIPAFVWKVALVLPRDHKLADVHDYRDFDEVDAVIMPNEPVVNSDWTTYKTTVAEIQSISGYDLLALLPDKIEQAVETNTRPPVAVVDGPYTSTEGSAVSLSGTGSFDGGGTITSYAWTFGDGRSGSGQTQSHTYTQDGSYAVRLIVTDNLGVADTSFTTANVSNVAPLISSFSGATLLPGETYSAEGSFADPGSDPWSATVNYGDGSGSSTLPLSGKNFTLAHVYNVPAMYQVEVRVSDDDVTSSRKQVVTVITPQQGLEPAVGMIQQLASVGKLDAGNANSLGSKLDVAQRQLLKGNSTTGANQLSALLNEIGAMVRSGRLSAADAEPLQTLLSRVISALSV
jgi:DNA/RNA endonuclease G (NUC1)